eukprot:364795-Chlamydomonas_euryale.AAC.3
MSRDSAASLSSDAPSRSNTSRRSAFSSSALARCDNMPRSVGNSASRLEVAPSDCGPPPPPPPQPLADSAAT